MFAKMVRQHVCMLAGMTGERERKWNSVGIKKKGSRSCVFEKVREDDLYEQVIGFEQEER